MSADSRPRPRDLARDCGEIATAVAVARDRIGQGLTADLDALANRLDELFDAIAMVAGATTPGADLETHRLSLLGLAEEIEALGGVIGDECRRCSAELARGGASARAVAAYTKITRS